MQPNPSPPTPTPATAFLRSRSGLLALGAVALLAIVGVGGYLVGAAQVGHATLQAQVTNNMASSETVSVTVNGAIAGSLTIAPGATGTLDVPVAYATANGASFVIQAAAPQGPHDSGTVFVNTPGIFVVSLSLG